MKKLVSLLLVLCLSIGVVCTALADAMPAFTVQPVDSTTDKYGNLSLTFKGTDFVANDSSWHFIEPDTGKEWTGPQLRDEMKARKQGEFTLTASDKKQALYLTHVPKFMHGWEVYVELVNKGNKVESNHIHIYWYGLDPKQPYNASASNTTTAAKDNTTAKTEQTAKTEKTETAAKTDTAATAGQAATEGTTAADGTAEEPEVPEEPAGPKIITVTAADKLMLYPMDSRGNAIEDEKAATLTFEDSGNVVVTSESPVKYWMLNGIRVESEGEAPTTLKLKNITSDLTLGAKFQTSSGSSASAEEVDPDSPCEVTCTGCTFTYHKGGLKSVSSGTVPAGATIIVFTSDTKAAQKGFSINGGDPEYQGSTSFRLKIEDDTTISIP